MPKRAAIIRDIVKKKPLLILGILYLFHLISNLVWLRLDTRYFLFDPAWYHYASLEKFIAVKAWFWNWFTLSPGRSGSLVYFLTLPFYFIFGSSQVIAAIISGSIFLAVLLSAVYGIGKRMHSREAGLLAAFIVSMYPIFFNQLRVYMFDLPLAAVVSLNIYLLLRTDYFRRKLFSVLYVLTIFAGILIKWNFLFFIIGPLALVLFKLPGKSFLRKKIISVPLILAIATAAVFTFPRLKPVFLYAWDNSLFRNIFSSGSWRESAAALVFVWFYSLLTSLLLLVNEALSFFFAAAAVFFSARVIKTGFKYCLFLLLPLLIPFALIIFFFNAIGFTPRYLLPGLVSLSLLTAIGVMQIKDRRIKVFTVIFIICFGITQYAAVSYGCRFCPQNLKLKLPVSFLRLPVFSGSFDILGMASTFERKLGYSDELILWRQEMGLFAQVGTSHPLKNSLIRRNVEKIMESCPVSKGDSFIFLDYSGDIGEVLQPLQLEFFPEIEKNAIQDPFYLNYDSEPNEYQPVISYLLTADYVAVVDDNEPPEGSDSIYLPGLRKEIARTKDYFFRHLDRFDLAAAVELTNGKKLLIYKNKENRIQAGPWEIKINNKSIMFFYQGKPLTEAIGLSSYFKYAGSYFSIFNTSCRLERSEPGYLSLRFEWLGLKISQVWRLRVEKNMINWQVYLYNPGKLPLEDLGLELRLVSNYRFWESNSDQGNFLPYSWGETISLRKKFTLIPGDRLVIRPAGPSEGLPGILYLPQNNYQQKNTMELYSASGSEFRIINFKLGDYGPDLFLEPGLIFSENFYFHPHFKERANIKRD